MENKVYLKVKDYSVSGEEFTLLRHDDLEMLLTAPKPKAEALADYYKSEDYISHTDHKRNLLEWLYHIIRKWAVRKKLHLLNSLKVDDKTLMDVGCGTGEFLAFSQKKGWKVWGVEPNAKARNKALDKLGKGVYDVDYLNTIEDNSIGVITLWHVLEHLPNLQKHIDIFNNALKPNGHLIIAVPNYRSYDAKYYNNYWAAFDVPRHLWHFSRSSIKTLFEQNGFNLVKERPMVFDSFYVSLLSEKYQSGRMNVLRAFGVGLMSNIKASRTREYSSIIYVFKKQNT